jgi:glycoside/pentoside/hexuronide:cation symporter, GPH family
MAAGTKAENKPEKLSFLTKFLYGVGDWGNSTTTTIVGFFFLYFLTDVAHLPPAFASPVMLIGMIWDAINDPLIGVFADKVHTRWGRRRPFFIIGAVPFGLAFILLWWVPPFTNNFLLMLYYLLAYILFDTAFTFVFVPYGTLTPELTQDYDERTQLNGFRMAVSMAGGLIAAFFVPVIASKFAEEKTGYLVMALIFGFLAMLPYFLLFFTIQEKYPETPSSDLSIIQSLYYAWKNRAFRFAAGIYMTAWMTVAMVSALFIYYVNYWMKLESQLEYLLAVVQLAAFICIPIIVKLANKMGKTQAYIVGMAWLTAVMLSLAFLPSTAGKIVYFLAALAGLGIAAAHVIPWSIIPDVVDDDELRTGFRREGTFYGYMVFFQKVGTAIILALIPWILSLTGYVANQPQNTATITAIRAMMGLLPTLLLSISMVLAWKFPITREKFAALRKEIEAKKHK